MKSVVLLCALVLGTNAFAHGVSPSEIYTLATLAVTLSPTISTEQLSSPARKALVEIENFNQTGELSLELQQAVSILQAGDETLSVQDALDILIERAESILKANN